MCNFQGQQGTTPSMCKSTSTFAWTSTGGGQGHDHNLSANFTGSSVSTLSPYLVLIYIIKT